VNLKRHRQALPKVKLSMSSFGKFSDERIYRAALIDFVDPTAAKQKVVSVTK
jgi:hypothetical protein